MFWVMRAFKVWNVVCLCLVVVAGVYYAAGNSPKVIKKVNTSEKLVALTVDDGPNPKSTPQLLHVLHEKDVKVTMFVLGKNAEKHPELLMQAAQEGHEIASHAYNHVFLNKLAVGELHAELDKTEQIIRAVTNKPTLLRPPGGGYNDAMVREAQKKGYTCVLWSIDTQDWKRPSAESIVNQVMAEVKPGSIVLLHDGQDNLPTATAIGLLLDRLQQRGYRVVTVSELLQYEGR